MEGFKGKKNVYMCGDCGHGFISKDVDEGTTPFMTSCLNCDGHAKSMFYKIPQDILGRAAVLWIKPPVKDWKHFSKATQDHLKRGGLVRSDFVKEKLAKNKRKAFRQ
jgi:hypothetical protein